VELVLEKFGSDQIRINFIEGLLRPNKVLNPDLLRAFSIVPREDFLPALNRQVAYIDSHILLTKGRFLLSPFVLAQLLNSAELKRTDKVLVVGCAMGYSVALLKEIVAEVYGLEVSEELRENAEQNLEKLFEKNMSIHLGPLVKGAPENAPYSVIVIEGAVNQVPQELLDQLAIDGRLVAILQQGSHLGKGTVFHKKESGITQVTTVDVYAPHLPGFEPVAQFKL
jgi:protein-L-isoaspartate(D-aspartate) O-methyltransferase